MKPWPDDYFKGINFDRPWEEEDWERFFAAQERLARDYHRLKSAPARPASDPSLTFRKVLERFGMDPDNPDAEPKAFVYRAGEPSESPLELPGIKFWQEGADPETLPIYCQAKCQAYRVALLVDGRFDAFLRKKYKSRAYREFQDLLEEWRRISQRVPKLVAAAHRLGYDPIGVKGNIVRCRRALEEADVCVGFVSRLPGRHFAKADRQRLLADAIRLRTSLLRWVDLLRSRFTARRDNP